MQWVNGKMAQLVYLRRAGVTLHGVTCFFCQNLPDSVVSLQWSWDMEPRDIRQLEQRIVNGNVSSTAWKTYDANLAEIQRSAYTENPQHGSCQQ